MTAADPTAYPDPVSDSNQAAEEAGDTGRVLPTTSADWRELVAVLLLSVTAILTAWTAFQSSKWSGAMSISFSQASTARIEASRFESNANRQLTIQVNLYTQWVTAVASEDTRLADYLRERFPEPLKAAATAWLELKPLENPDAPATPFEMPEYVQPDAVAAVESDARADAKFQEALDNNQRGDNYTVLTILFAAVLFFAAVSGRVRRNRNAWILLGIAIVVFLGTTITLATFPKLI